MKEQPECRVNKYGTKSWWLNDKLHYENGPAVEHADGSKLYYFHGQLHRKGGPAIEYSNGCIEYWLHGQLHCENGPAYKGAGGRKYWFLHGKEVQPQALVDLWLSRGVSCYYDEKADELKFQSA